MSWSAPSSGSAPPYQPAPAYAQQPYPQQPPYGQPPFAQPPYQQSGPPPSQSSSAPTTYPPKRKGNPVITRYPPPPGYRPPPPPSGQPPYHGQYPPPSYRQPPQGYPSQPYPQGYPAYQPPPQGYQPAAWQPPSGYPPPQEYQQQGYQQPPPPPDASGAPSAYPPTGFQQSPTYPPSSQPGSYPPPESAISPTTTAPPVDWNSPPSQSSRPSRSRRSTRTASIVPTEVPESHKLYQSEAYAINLGLDEWDQTDFDGAIWPKANEPVDSNFSLGVIIWHPANETTRALSSDFTTAEERAAKPPLPKLGNGDSVSEYFGTDNAHEAFLNVRQTDEWDSIKQDSIFYEFPKTSDIVALEDVLANRDRPDPEGENPYPNVHEIHARAQRQEAEWNVMDNLEQALSSEQAEDGSRRESRNDEVTLSPLTRDDAQEALLASLGVTGSPKPVKPLSTPTFLPPKPPKPSAQKGSDHDRPFAENLPRRPPAEHNGYSLPTSHSPVPPQQTQDPPSFDKWMANQALPRKGRQSSVRSENSQHTTTGSDLHMEDNEAPDTNTPKPQRPRPTRADSSAGRKRSYEETESPQRQEDDYTPRIKRRQPAVAAAYGPDLDPEGSYETSAAVISGSTHGNRLFYVDILRWKF